MAGLMSRASLVVKSKFSKLLDRAEDPGETLDYSYEKQLELLQNVKRGIADVDDREEAARAPGDAACSRAWSSSTAQARAGAGSRPRGPRAARRSSGRPAVQQQLQALDAAGDSSSRRSRRS